MIIYLLIIIGNFRIFFLYRKKLSYGSLLCVSDDGFKNFFWVTITESYSKKNNKNNQEGDFNEELLNHKPRPRVYVKIISNNINFKYKGFERGIKYEMAESPEIFFESYV